MQDLNSKEIEQVSGGKVTVNKAKMSDKAGTAKVTVNKAKMADKAMN